jgi:hypothetical protein
MTEIQLQEDICRQLAKLGVWAFRVKAEHGVRRSNGPTAVPPGTPDIRVEAGWGGWLEVKLTGQLPSPKQLQWHTRARGCGSRVAIVHSVKEAVDTVLQWRRRAVW